MPDQLLSGVKVLDLTHYISGPYCTKLLADYGADIIKVERPGTGDGARRLGPFFKDHAHPEVSGLFLHLNTNKRGVTLNLKSSVGVRLFKELVRWADVMVENFRPGVVRRLGLHYQELRRVNPRLLMVSISNFGQTGPYRDFELEEIIGYAMGGMMHATGLPDREPLKLGGRVGLYQAGSMAALATVTALYGCRAASCGDYIDISIMETQAGSIDRRANAILAYQYTGETFPRREPNPLTRHRPCRDGYIEMWGVGSFLGRLVEAMGRPDLLEETGISSLGQVYDLQNAEAFEENVLAWCLGHTKGEIWRLAQDARVPSGPVNSTKELMADPHFRERGFWSKVYHTYTGELEYPGRPFVPSETCWRVRRPAPLLGQHNMEIFCGRFGYSSSELAKIREMGVI